MRRLKQVLLPTIIVAGVVIGFASVMALALEKSYQAKANQEAARLIGAMLAENPEVDTARLIRALASNDEVNLERGQELLREYGYLSSDFASPNAEAFTRKLFLLLICSVVGFAVITLSYFWHRDWREERKIAELVKYLQNLKEHIYDLRLEENSEDQLSFLTNEIYKITVLLKEAAENNRAYSQNLETALADISHQLRTPLTSLQVVIDNIYDDPEMPFSVRQDFLRSASRQVENMSSLVMTLLNLAKFDNGSIKLHSQPVQVGELLEEVRQNLGVLSEIDDVEIELNGDLHAVAEFDPRWQREALMNIIKNSIEHSKAGSKVEILIEDSPLYLKIMIVDHGEGIAQADLHHIFERFYKAKNSSSESIGIGLAFAKTVIESDNGQVSVKSEPGKGTIFTVKYFK